MRPIRQACPAGQQRTRSACTGPDYCRPLPHAGENTEEDPACAPSAGLVHITAAGSATLSKCSILGPTAVACSALLVDSGSAASLLGCDVGLSKQGRACTVLGPGCSFSAASGCSFRDSCYSGLLIGVASTAELRNCSVTGSRSDNGLVIFGAGTSVSAKQCRFEGNERSNVAVIVGAVSVGVGGLGSSFQVAPGHSLPNLPACIGGTSKRLHLPCFLNQPIHFGVRRRACTFHSSHSLILPNAVKGSDYVMIAMAMS
jgi:hypothetical protein